VTDELVQNVALKPAKEGQHQHCVQMAVRTVAKGIVRVGIVSIPPGNVMWLGVDLYVIGLN
jgi:hypothetical protein